MVRQFQRLGSLVLLAALAVPVGMQAQPRDDHDRDHDRDHRYYDKNHKDYHHWDDHENAAYRHWTEENHRKYQDFGHLSSRDQQRYWAWRHDHPNWR
jgi:hypothetical protein